MVASISSVEEINKVIESCNPFDRPFFVKQEDVWGQGFPDVPSINAHVSDAVFEAIEKVRSNQRDTIGITITAERGLGKSHIISRIRHQLQADGKALFVYMSEYSNLDQIKREFLHTLAQSLRRVGSHNVTQWQEVATALLSDVYRKDFQPKQMVDSIFPNQIAKYLAEGKQAADLVSKLRDAVLQAKPEIDDPYLVQALIWTLSKPHALFAINWLAGKSLAQAQAEALGLPGSENDDEETTSLHTARKTLNLIGAYKTIVICFDELDGTGVNQAGETRAMVVASLAKDIANDFKRGILLTSLYPTTFSHQVRAIPNAEAVIDRIAEKILELKPLNSDNVVALVSQYLKSFYGDKGLIPPNSVYPFDELRLRQIGEEKPIVREVLKWCAKNFGKVELTPVNKIERAFEKEIADLEWAIDDYLEDKETLAHALRLAFKSLVGTNKMVEKVEVTGIEEVSTRSSDKGYIDFKIVGKELIKVHKKPVKIGVSIVQQSNSKTVTTTLKKLKDYERFDLTRGCMIRSKSISPTAKLAYDTLREFLQNKGEWVLLMPEHIKPLLAILFVYNRIEDYELSEQEVLEFIRERNLAAENPLVCEILSKPTGKIPSNATNEDLVPLPPSLSNGASYENMLDPDAIPVT